MMAAGPEMLGGAQAEACPPGDVLEALAADSCADAAARAHAAACVTCREAVAEIRANQQFMKDFLSVTRLREQVAAKAPPEPEAECAVPGYEILGEYKRGGQGVIYKALQAGTKRKVAVKMPLTGVLSTDRDRRRFENEITLVARMRHPYVVTVYDSGITEDGRYYVAMEYVRGDRLDEWSRRLAEKGGGPDPRRMLRARVELMAKVCEAVQYAHTRGIMHRDLKPGNIMVDGEDNPRLLDFGIARRTLPGGLHPTITGQFAGTLAYASPEQVEGDPDAIDTRTDVYSLGVVLYELLTGKFPYPIDVPLAEVIRHITQTQAQRLGEHPEAGPIDDEIETIVLKALSKDRERRYQTAAALGSDLRHYLTGDPIDAKRDSTFYMLKKAVAKNRRTLAIAAAAVGAMALVTVVFLAVLGRAMRDLRTTKAQSQQVTADLANTTRSLNDRAAELSSVSASLAAVKLQTRLARGASLTLLGQLGQAEEEFWLTLLDEGVTDVTNPQLGFGGREEVRRTWWALCDVYSRHPCLGTWQDAAGYLHPVAYDAARSAVLQRGDAGNACWWSIPEGKALESWRLGNQIARVTGWVLDPGGRLVLFSRDGSARLVEMATGREVARVDDPEMRFMACGLSGDGKQVAAVGKDHVLRLYSGATLGLVREVAQGWGVGNPAFSADGRFVCGPMEGAEISVFDTRTGARVRELRGNVKPLVDLVGLVWVTTWSGDGRWLAVLVGTDLILWSAQSGDEPIARRMNVQAGTANGLAFSEDSGRIFTWSSNESIRTWAQKATPGGTELAMVDELRVRSTGGVLLAENGELIIVGDQFGRGRIFESRTLKWFKSLITTRGEGASNSAIRWEPDGKGLMTACSDGLVHKFGPTLDRTALAWPAHKTGATCIDISRDGSMAVTTGRDGAMRIWDLHGTAGPEDATPPKLKTEWKCEDDRFINVAFSPDGRWVVAGSIYAPPGDAAQNRSRLWAGETTGGSLHTVATRQLRIVTPAFSPDGRYLAATCGDGRCMIFDWPSGSPRAELAMPELRAQMRPLCFNPAGTILAVGDDLGRISLWDPRTGTQIRDWYATTQDLFALAFHPSGKVLAAGDRGGSIKLWDVETGELLTTLKSGGAMAPIVFGLDFSPDGDQLAAAFGFDPTETLARVGVWDLMYYTKHLAGNYRYWTDRHAAEKQRDSGASK